jgi:acyl-CoA synthetase (AMP-forming)/AMP-acid ligase II
MAGRYAETVAEGSPSRHDLPKESDYRMHPRDHATTHPDKPATIFSTGEVQSYAALEAASNRAARLIRSHGVGAGDYVALFLENEPEYFELAWACQRIGVCFVPVSSRLTADELAYILGDCGARLIFASPSLAKVAGAAAGGIPLVLTNDDYRQSRDAFADGPLEGESAGIDMVYSSGTTGRPKGIRTLAPLGPIDAPHRIATMAAERYGVGPDSVYLSPAPIYHAAPLKWCMGVHRLGGTVIAMRKFDAEEVLRLIERHRVTHAQFVPTHFARLLDLPEEVRARYDISSLKVAIHAAAPCPVEVKRRMIEWWGPILYEFYGGSEGIGNTIVTPAEWLERPGTVGKAHNCTIRICDDEGELLPAGEIGTVYMADGQRFEYLNDPVKTQSCYNQYGWATMGDAGYLDKDGYLYLTDRKDFMIISGGVNIYPREVEEALLAHPAVRDAAVVGAPHRDLGEQVAAVVEPRDWALAGPALAAELRTFLRQQLSAVKTPRRIDFMEELPRLPTGKLLKRQLRDALHGRDADTAARLLKGLEA